MLHIQAPSLPAELIHQISDLCGRPSLARLCLVSHDWYAVCGPKVFANLHVYFQPWLDAKRTLGLLYALAQTPRLGSHVRSLRIRVLLSREAQPCTMCRTKKYSKCAGRQAQSLPSGIIAELHAKAAGGPGRDWWLANCEIPSMVLWAIAGQKLITCDNFVNENKTLVMATLILALRTCVNLELLELPPDNAGRPLDDQCVLEAARSTKRLRYLIVPRNIVARQTRYKEPGLAFQMLAYRSAQENGVKTLIIANQGGRTPALILACHWLATHNISVVVLDNLLERATRIDVLPAFYWFPPEIFVSKAMSAALHQYLADVHSFCTDSRNRYPAWQPQKLVIRMWPDQLGHLLSVVDTVTPVKARIERVVLHLLSTEVAPDQDIMVIRGLTPLRATLKKVVFRQNERSGENTVAEFMLAAKRADFDKLKGVQFHDVDRHAALMARLIRRSDV